jgi:predicted dehydrogenase
MTRWRVGLLGAGMMAQGFDRPDSPHVLSMAHAFSRSDRFTIGGFFDATAGRAAAAEQTWGVPPSPRQREAWLDVGWDVVYIATPDANHAGDVRDVLGRSPCGVLVEKPLSLDGQAALASLAAASALGIPLMVNFPRRWHSGVTRLREMATRAELSPPTAAFVAVSGAATHNLPHTVDLMRSIWGGGWTVRCDVPKSHAMTSLAWSRGDTVCTMVVAERPPVPYVWEAHFYCPEGKVELSHSPEVLEWAAPGPHPLYLNYSVLTSNFRYDMESEPLLDRAVAALAQALDDSSIAAGALDGEMESQRLSAQVLQWF